MKSRELKDNVKTLIKLAVDEKLTFIDITFLSVFWIMLVLLNQYEIYTTHLTKSKITFNNPYQGNKLKVKLPLSHYRKTFIWCY